MKSILEVYPNNQINERFLSSSWIESQEKEKGIKSGNLSNGLCGKLSRVTCLSYRMKKRKREIEKIMRMKRGVKRRIGVVSEASNLS